MKNDEFSTAFYVRALRERAREEGEAEEFNPREHTFWAAADRLEELDEIISILDGKREPSRELLASLLTRIAGVLQLGGMHHKYTYTNDEKP